MMTIIFYSMITFDFYKCLSKLVASPKAHPTVCAPEVVPLPPLRRSSSGGQGPKKQQTSNAPWAPNWGWLGGGH